MFNNYKTHSEDEKGKRDDKGMSIQQNDSLYVRMKEDKENISTNPLWAKFNDTLNFQWYKTCGHSQTS